MRINIYTDGGCSGNPGPGGWAFVLFPDPAGASLLGEASEATKGGKSPPSLQPTACACGLPLPPSTGAPRPRNAPGPEGASLGRGLISKNGGEAATTNNRMELTAVINALEMVSSLGGPIDGVTVFTDSQYVQKGISEWIVGWKQKGWITSAKQPVKNADLWKKLDALAAGYAIRWQWVKGHAGNPLNERCDALVQEAIQAVRAGLSS
ncbi:MAG: ribonuclease HI [Spirochaetaceae bacterium]|nr:ribonuclease HI [Spirochaetaceae bacterium]